MLSKELDHSQARYAQLTDKHEQATASLANAETQLQELNRQLLAVQQDLQSSQTRVSEQASEAEQLESSKNALSQSLMETQAQVAATAQVNSTLSEEMSALRLQLEHESFLRQGADQEARTAMERIYDLEAAVTAREEVVAQLKQVVAKQTDQVEQLESAVATGKQEAEMAQLTWDNELHFARQELQSARDLGEKQQAAREHEQEEFARQLTLANKTQQCQQTQIAELSALAERSALNSQLAEAKAQTAAAERIKASQHALALGHTRSFSHT